MTELNNRAVIAGLTRNLNTIAAYQWLLDCFTAFAMTNYELFRGSLNKKPAIHYRVAGLKSPTHSS